MAIVMVDIYIVSGKMIDWFYLDTYFYSFYGNISIDLRD